jgi:hypothetical protein
MLFGMASALSVILAIWILGDINPEKFTTAQELLRHCIELFDDANKNNCDVKLLILFPNPGQFDETFESPREYDFSDLKKKLTHCFNNESVHIEIVCFQGDTTSPDSTLRKFLNKFYESESPDINPQLLEKRGNIEGYCGPVKNFKDEYLTNRSRLTLERIDDGWFDKMAVEEPMIVIGYAKREAFLGAITFKGRKFNFVGFDFDGNVGTIAPLYEAMKAKYTTPPPTSPQTTTP